MNPRDCVWKELRREFMRTILQGKVYCTITIWYTNLFPCLKQRTYQQQKQWTKNGKNLKISAWKLAKVRNKSEVIEEARNKGVKVLFVSLMDIIHLKNADLEKKHQKYKGRVVLPGDIVKDDSGFYAVFTEQESSASQMTAAKVMDIISRLPGCAGKAADALPAYTQVKMEDAHKLLKIPKSECPDICIRLPRHKWLKSWSSMEAPVVPLERNLYGHPLAGLLWERKNEKVLLEHGWKKFLIGNAYSHTDRKDHSCLCTWMTSNWLARKKISIRCGKYSTKKSIQETQHHSLIISTWSALKDDVKPAPTLLTITEPCSNPEFPQEQ